MEDILKKIKNIAKTTPMPEDMIQEIGYQEVKGLSEQERARLGRGYMDPEVKKPLPGFKRK